MSVVDAQNNPLPGATISIFDFLFDSKVTTGVSNYRGKIKFKLLGNTINKYGWKTPENNSYYILGTFEKHSAEDRGGTFMEENKVATIKFSSVNKKKEEQKPLISTETFIIILIIIIVLVLVWLSVAGRSKRNQSDKSGRGTDKNKNSSPKRAAPPGKQSDQLKYSSKPKGRKIRR